MTASSSYTDVLIRIRVGTETECKVELSVNGADEVYGTLPLKGDDEKPTDEELNAAKPESAYGALLFAKLFSDEATLKAYYEAIGTKRPLRIRLRIDEDVKTKIAHWKWECLWDEAGPIATNAERPFSRYIEVPGEIPFKPPTTDELRILVTLANPKLDDFDDIEVDENVISLLTFLKQPPKGPRLKVTLMPGQRGLSEEVQRKVEDAGWTTCEGPTSRDNVQDQLSLSTPQNYQIWHHIGHGSRRTPEIPGPGMPTEFTQLYLESSSGDGAEAWPDYEIEKFIKPLAANPYLVFLDACEGAEQKSYDKDPGFGMGPRLVTAGVPAVVAMQNQVRFDIVEAIQVFYRQLLSHGVVDVALNEARNLIANRAEHKLPFDWTIPVLFMRLKDGRLFDIGVDQDNGISFEELILQCKKATAQEIKIVGSKYISELYFPRYRLEARFEKFLDTDTTCFLIVAKAGRGKTNLMCHIVEEWQDKRPVLFIAGRKEPKDDYDFLRHIAIRLGYDERWPMCLKDLRAVSKPGLEPLILIDGINESSAKPGIMQAALRELLVQTAIHQIKVCVTCRTDFWRFYRAPFWAEYIWKDEKTSLAGKLIRGEDLGSFPEENFDEIVRNYFEYFGVQGELVEEAWDRCRNPLLLRFFCEAYRNHVVQTVSQIRLYPLFKLFWSRKIEQVQDLSGLPQPYPVNQFVLTIARLMRQRHQTRVPRENIVQVVDSDAMQSDSLYFRILDEEIILEEEVDELTGTTNVIFVYDKFSEYAIALSIFSDLKWYEAESSIIKDEVIDLMQEEEAFEFATLRGALEFAVLRVEDQRFDTGIHFNIIKAMLDYDWKWRRIGSLLAFQLTQIETDSFWNFIAETLIRDERDFVRRICAEKLGRLAIYNANLALPLLNKCLEDKSSSVRQVARETLFNLDPTVAIQEAELLVAEKPFGADSISLAADTLLSPADSHSLHLQNKARWLVKKNRNSEIQKAIFDFFANLEPTPYEDLYVLEEYERAFQIDWRRNRRPSNPYLETIQQNLVPKRNALEVDLKRLNTLCNIRNSLFSFAVETLEIRRIEPKSVLKANLDLLVPDADARKDFLEKIENVFHVSLPKWEYGTIEDESVEEQPSSITLEVLAFEIARSTPDFADQSSASHLVSLSPQIEGWYDWYEYFYHISRMMQLCQIADDLLKKAAIVTGSDPSTITLDTQLGQNGLNLEPEECNSFRNGAASQIGVELNAVQHRALSNLGRLSFWLWQVEESTQEREETLARRIDSVRHLGTDALRQRLSVFETITLPEESESELVLELQAICRSHAKFEPTRVVEALAPLIIWHNENESSVLSQAFQSLYWRERDSFWDVAQSLLEQEDQRIIDFANQVLEEAEHIEENLGSSEFYDRVRAIIVEILGVEEIDITPESHFRDDLEADSLALVELIMAFEEEFGFEILDEDAQRINTVGEAVEFLATRIS